MTTPRPAVAILPPVIVTLPPMTTEEDLKEEHMASVSGASESTGGGYGESTDQAGDNEGDGDIQDDEDSAFRDGYVLSLGRG
jgi:hypothetical protein